jgi:hypothetical protein
MFGPGMTIPEYGQTWGIREITLYQANFKLFMPYFRSQVLEKITQESSNDTKLALIKLLDEEGNRSRTIAEAEMQAGVAIDIRTLELHQAEKDADAKIQQERIKADTAAGRGRAQGSGRLEDRMPPAPKEGGDRT